MNPKLKYFVFDRKEFAMITLIVLVVGALAFTTGVHYGKQYAVTTGEVHEPFQAPETLAQQPEKTPHERDLDFHTKDAARKAEVSIDKTLQQEVVRSGIQLDRPLAVRLPKETKFKKAPRLAAADTGALTAGKGASGIAKEALEGITQEATLRDLPSGKYTLQIGTYQKVEDTRSQLRAFESIGLKPVLRVSQLKGNSGSFRLYHGGFSTTNEAEDAGKALLSQGKIDSFVVVNRPSDHED